MEFIATQKYLIESPRKIREVVTLIKKLSPTEAIAKLEFVNKRASKALIKVIKTVLGQAKIAGVSENALKFKEIQVGEGPRLKRGRPVSRGRWHPYIKPMAHIRVVLTKEDSQIQESESLTNLKRESPKPEPKATNKKVR